MPALTNSTSMRPCSALICCIRACVAAMSDMSERKTRPFSPRSDWTCASVSGSRPVTITNAPSCAKASALARPMPLLPPRTTTVRPVNRLQLVKTVSMSEHSVVVCRAAGQFLRRIPVFGDEAVLNSEDVDHGDAGRAGRDDHVDVRDDVLAIGKHPLHVMMGVGRNRLGPNQKCLQPRSAGFRHWAVLN